MRIFIDFKCSNGHTTEKLIDNITREIECPVYSIESDLSCQDLSKYILDSDLSLDYTNLVIKISDEWKLSDFPIVENRSKESWDIFIAFTSEEDELIEDTNQLVLNSIDFSHMVLSKNGLNELSKTSILSNALDLDEDLSVRVTRLQKSIRLPQRESLASASRFAQLFYWMLETKHPLLLFGIPGIVLFVLGYNLSGNVLVKFSELNTTSIGVTLTTIAMTLVGLFAIMVALILYIMGKQVEQIQSQYDWSR